MTGTNHVLTGALIAVAVQRPLLAIPLAFVSHFVIDAVPHYGYGYIPTEHRDKQSHFLTKQAIDAYVALGLYLILPWILKDYQTPLVTAVCMLMAQAPDVYWIYEYIKAQRRGGYSDRNWYARFHKAIQWCERPWGMYIEIIWFASIGLLIWTVTR